MNDILCGYIYGMKLGFEMITIDKNQGKYLYPQTWSIDVCDFASLNSIERVFLLFKILPKQLVLTHWQLNLLWLISSNLDLHIDLLKMSNLTETTTNTKYIDSIIANFCSTDGHFVVSKKKGKPTTKEVYTNIMT